MYDKEILYSIIRRQPSENMYQWFEQILQQRRYMDGK